MQDSRRKESDVGTEQEIKQRQSEATSKETVEDLEDTQKDLAKAIYSSDPPDPAGEFDERRDDDPSDPM